jgi:hypothetical protein
MRLGEANHERPHVGTEEGFFGSNQLGGAQVAHERP